MKICHIINMPDMSEMGEISRIIFNETEGEHIFCKLHDEKIPDADIYLLECFKNQKHFPKQILFHPPSGKKLISLIHSSEPCLPSKYSNIVVTITNAWQKRLKRLYNINSKMIYGGIDLDKYKNVKINYKNKVFGKITRPEAGKYHKDWNFIAKQLLDDNNFFSCRIISNNYKKINWIDHERTIYIEGVRINDYERKIKELSKLSVYTECHSDSGNAFIDTFCISVLEAMACGLPILALRGLQEPLVEVIGNAGIICNDIDEYRIKLNNLLLDDDLKEELGNKARERAKFFSKEKLINKWNKLFKEVLHE